MTRPFSVKRGEVQGCGLIAHSQGLSQRSTELDADSSHLPCVISRYCALATVHPGQVKESPAGQARRTYTPLYVKFYGKFLRGLTPSPQAAVK